MKSEELEATLNSYFDMAYKQGVHYAMVRTTEAILEDFQDGKVIDADYLKQFIAYVKKQIFQEEYPTYQDYLQSDEWKAKASAAKERAGWRCQLCNKKGNKSTLHAHHRTYDRIGNEEDGDIIALCSKCHAKFHNKD